MQFNIKQHYTNDDSTFLKVETVIAFICILIPWILCAIDGGLRDSISAYVNMNESQYFGLLLTMASMMFIFNGALYFGVEDSVETKTYISQCNYNKPRKGKWYNLILGIALMGVVIFDFKNQKILHYTFAVIFFVGSALVMFFIHDPDDIWKSRILAIGSLLCLGISVFDENILSLFWSETIALTIIGIHYILESRRIWM